MQDIAGGCNRHVEGGQPPVAGHAGADPVGRVLAALEGEDHVIDGTSEEDAGGEKEQLGQPGHDNNWMTPDKGSHERHISGVLALGHTETD